VFYWSLATFQSCAPPRMPILRAPSGDDRDVCARSPRPTIIAALSLHLWHVGS
jgi:hypothetical protein